MATPHVFVFGAGRKLRYAGRIDDSAKPDRVTSHDTQSAVDALDDQWQGALPYTLLVAPGGKIIYRKQGELDPLEVKHAIVGYLGRVYK